MTMVNISALSTKNREEEEDNIVARITVQVRGCSLASSSFSPQKSWINITTMVHTLQPSRRNTKDKKEWPNLSDTLDKKINPANQTTFAMSNGRLIKLKVMWAKWYLKINFYKSVQSIKWLFQNSSINMLDKILIVHFILQMFWLQNCIHRLNVNRRFAKKSVTKY